MGMIEAKLHVDPANDAAEIVVDLVGNDPFQHEFLKQVFAGNLSTTEDEGAGTDEAMPHAKVLGPEDVRVRFGVRKKGAAEDARRAVAGLPSLEEEAEAKAKADADAASAFAAVKTKEDHDQAAQAEGFKDAADKEAVLAEIRRDKAIADLKAKSAS